MKKEFFNTIKGPDSVCIMLYGDVGDNMAVESARVVNELMMLSSQYGTIDVRINSNGGDVFNGIAIYNALKASDADITVYVDGVAASIAGVIALCGKPLYMSQYARLMLHSVSGGAFGDSKSVRGLADIMDGLQADLAKMIAGRCNMKPEDVSAKYFDGGDHWITADEALSMKLIDGIYDTGDPSENVPETAEGVYNYFNSRLLAKPRTSSDTLMMQLMKVPAFKDKTDIPAIMAHITEIVSKAEKWDRQALDDSNRELSGLIKSGIIDTAEKRTVTVLRDHDPEGYIKYVETKKSVLCRRKEREYDDIVDKYKLKKYYQDEFIRGGMKRLAMEDLDAFADIVRKISKPVPLRVLDSLAEAQTSRSRWTLADYRKHAPKELRDNPDLYGRLLEEENLTNKKQ